MSRRLTAIASATPRSSDSMPGIRRRRVDEDDDRPAELLGQPHRAQRLAVALRPRVAEVAVDLLLGVAALDVADEQHRLALVVGEAGHDRVVVGEAAVAVDLDEAGEQPLDEVLEAGTARDGARPARAATASATRRARARIDSSAPAQRLDLAIARVGARQHATSASISFSSDGDRLFEVEQFSAHGRARDPATLTRSDTDPAPTICSTSAISADEGRTRICDETSARTRRRRRRRRQLDLERDPPVAAMPREDLAERLEHRRGRPAS